MNNIEKALELVQKCLDDWPYAATRVVDIMTRLEKVNEILKEQEELLKHEYWRGYNNGRADERGLQEGTIMQTFSPD